MKFNGKAFALAFLVTLALWAIAEAITIDEVWRKVFDSVNNAIRINKVL